MNNLELERLLKNAEVPTRSDEYWEQFPKQVTAKTHWQSQAVGKLAMETPRRLTLAVLFKGLGLASACIAVGLTISFWRGDSPGENTLQLAQARKYYREIEALFPNQIQAIVFDEKGAHLILAEKADVPNSPPVYLNICGPRGCQSFVTFSGQHIRINGDDCDVLMDGNGNVLLAGKQLIWSGASPNRAGKYHIEAHALEKSS